MRCYIGRTVRVLLAGSIIVGMNYGGWAGAAEATAKPKPKPVAKPAAKPATKPGAKPAAKPTAEKKASVTKVNAAGALDGAQKAFAVLSKEARADKGLDPKTPKNKPFWIATQKIAKQLARSEKGLKAKNDEFFKGVREARAAEQELKVSWELTGSKNKKVIDAGKRLGHALAILRTDFSKEAQRKKKGGKLTPKESQELAKIKGQQKALLGKTKSLAAKAKADKRLQPGLKKIASRAEHIANAPDTLDGFLTALFMLEEIEGLIHGYDYYVGKDLRTDWVDVPKMTTQWKSAYTEVDTSETYDWKDASKSVEVTQSEDFAGEEEISEAEIESEENFAESESFEMSDTEEEEVAMEEDSDPDVGAADNADDASMEDASDDAADASDDAEDASDDVEDASDDAGDASDDAGDATDDAGDASDDAGDASDDAGDASDDAGDASDSGGADEGGDDCGGGDDSE